MAVFCIPSYAVLKSATSSAVCASRRRATEARRHVPAQLARLRVVARTVLTAIDEEGLTVAGWFAANFPATPRSLRAHPIDGRRHAQRRPLVSSARGRWPTGVLRLGRLSHGTLAEARYAHAAVWRAAALARVQAPSQRARGADAGVPVVRSRRADLALDRNAPRGLHDSECVVCFKEGPVLVASCCGVAAATCRECNERLRGVCIVCQRHVLSAKFTCACCGTTDVALDDYGHPCDTCAARVLCSGCYSARAPCCACDPLRQ